MTFLLKAAEVMHSNPDNPAAIKHFEDLKKEWSDQMKKMQTMLKKSFPPLAYVTAFGTISLTILHVHTQSEPLDFLYHVSCAKLCVSYYC